VDVCKSQALIRIVVWNILCACHHQSRAISNEMTSSMSRTETLPQPVPSWSGHSEAWQRELWSHAPEYGAEFIGTAFLVFCVVGAVAAMFAPESAVPSRIPSVGVRLFITGLVLGGVGGLVAITPLGRLSGAHLDPAISLGFFVEGRMHLHDLVGYITAQMIGGSIGAWAGAAVFGRSAAAVQDALNQPATHVSPLAAVLAESAATFVLAELIFVMVSHRSLMRWTPLAATGVVGILVWLDGNFSGASLNPARSFGPALVTGDWHLYWIYLSGPCSGAVLAALLHRFAMPLESLTGKVFHDLRYRSIFTGRADHAANEHLRRQIKPAMKGAPPVHAPAVTWPDRQRRHHP
jgi:aquaporin Z